MLRKSKEVVENFSDTETSDLIQKVVDQYGVNTDEFPDKDVESANNYCRNIDGDELGPWCYVQTEDVHYKKTHCDIPYCSDVKKENR